MGEKRRGGRGEEREKRKKRRVLYLQGKIHIVIVTDERTSPRTLFSSS